MKRFWLGVVAGATGVVVALILFGGYMDKLDEQDRP